MEEFEPVIAYVCRFVELDEREKAHFSTFLKTKKVKRRQLIVQPGFVCTHKSYVVKGVLRAYFVGQEDKEHTQALPLKTGGYRTIAV